MCWWPLSSLLAPEPSPTALIRAVGSSQTSTMLYHQRPMATEDSKKGCVQRGPNSGHLGTMRMLWGQCPHEVPPPSRQHPPLEDFKHKGSRQVCRYPRKAMSRCCMESPVSPAGTQPAGRSLHSPSTGSAPNSPEGTLPSCATGGAARGI